MGVETRIDEDMAESQMTRDGEPGSIRTQQKEPGLNPGLKFWVGVDLSDEAL